MNAEQVLEAALHLERGEREQLIERLMESFVGENRFASKELERAWLAEIQRRSAKIDAGKAEIVDWTDVRSRFVARCARP